MDHWHLVWIELYLQFRTPTDFMALSTERERRVGCHSHTDDNVFQSLRQILLVVPCRHWMIWRIKWIPMKGTKLSKMEPYNITFLNWTLREDWSHHWRALSKPSPARQYRKILCSMVLNSMVRSFLGPGKGHLLSWPKLLPSLNQAWSHFEMGWKFMLRISGSEMPLHAQALIALTWSRTQKACKTTSYKILMCYFLLNPLLLRAL